MSASIIDSKIFGDMFSDAAMRQVWSDENRTAKYLDIERALAKVQGELGLIPQEAADEIVRWATPVTSFQRISRAPSIPTTMSAMSARASRCRVGCAECSTISRTASVRARRSAE